MTMRLFAALVPPAAVLDALEVFVEPRRQADPALRWVTRENWHLTLGFFGDVPDGRVESLTEALDEIHFPPFGLTLEGAGAFPDPAKARVLWLGTVAGTDPVERLGRKVRTAADRVGVASDNAKHRPHLTLARIRQGLDVTRWLRVVDSFPPLSWPVGEFHLVHSRLGPGGPRYESIARFALTARPDSDRPDAPTRRLA